MAIKNVMVVDDSPTEQHMLREMLTKNGFSVSVVNSGEEAITRSKAEKPDLILMDVVMPGMSGFEATREAWHLPPHPQGCRAQSDQRDCLPIVDHHCDVVWSSCCEDVLMVNGLGGIHRLQTMKAESLLHDIQEVLNKIDHEIRSHALEAALLRDRVKELEEENERLRLERNQAFFITEQQAELLDEAEYGI